MVDRTRSWSGGGVGSARTARTKRLPSRSKVATATWKSDVVTPVNTGHEAATNRRPWRSNASDGWACIVQPSSDVGPVSETTYPGNRLAPHVRPASVLR